MYTEVRSIKNITLHSLLNLFLFYFINLKKKSMVMVRGIIERCKSKRFGFGQREIWLKTEHVHFLNRCWHTDWRAANGSRGSNKWSEEGLRDQTKICRKCDTRKELQKDLTLGNLIEGKDKTEKDMSFLSISNMSLKKLYF